MAMLFLKFSFIQGYFRIYYCSCKSSCLIPSMIDLINRKLARIKLFLKCFSLAQVQTIPLHTFSLLLGIYMQTTSGEAISCSMQLLMIPLTIIISVAAGFIVYKLSKPIIEKISSSIGKSSSRLDYVY